MEIEYIIAIFVIVGIVLYLKRKKDNDVPTGLQTFDKNGNLVLDFTENTYRIYGFGETGTADGFITDSNITVDSFILPYNVLVQHTGGYESYWEDLAYGIYPFFKISDGKIEWVFRKETGAIYNVLFAYGGKI